MSDVYVESIQEAIQELRMAQTASCNCRTKTNDIRWHKEGCQYRILGEKIEELIQYA